MVRTTCELCGTNIEPKASRRYCPVCKEAKRKADNARYARNRYLRNPQEHRAQQKAWKARQRLSVLAHYGHKCACCGETRPEFLELHHTAGGGNARRRELRKNGDSLWGYLIRNGYPSGLQVLCANCHGAITWYGHCPHQGG